MEIELLSCPLCSDARFQSVVVLRNTLISVTKKPLSCPVCREVVIGLDKFTIHLFTHSEIGSELVEDVQVHINPDITNDVNDKNNNEDTVEHHVTPESCIENQTNYLQVDTQLKNVPDTSSSAKDTRCEICNFEFADGNVLEMHKNLLHSNGFSCHLCHKKFKMHGSLSVHMRVAHYGFKNKILPTQNENNETITKQEIVCGTSSNNELDNITAVKVQENKQWECEVCLKKFTTKYFLKKHKRLHTGEMPYECTLCNKSFTFQQSYHKHMLYHSTDKPHACTECGRAFKELSTLHNHQRIHSGERPFGCETCGKRFRQRVSYLVHRRIHTGAMPYKCTSCDKSFRYKVSQRTHKCKAQPPGSVVRQFGDLVQKLLQNRAEETTTKNTVNCQADEITNKPIDSSADANTDFFGLIMSPSFQMTSDQFESLCLSSKETGNNADEIFNNLRNEAEPVLNSTAIQESALNQTVEQECSTINEECLKQLLYHSHD